MAPPVEVTLPPVVAVVPVTNVAVAVGARVGIAAKVVKVNSFPYVVTA